jgi:hypothetical protein
LGFARVARAQKSVKQRSTVSDYLVLFTSLCDSEASLRLLLSNQKKTRMRCLADELMSRPFVYLLKED